jgi:hypothetical protein
MGGEFPEIEAEPDHHRKLGMDAGEITGNDGVEGAHDGELPPVFLGKVAKGK